MIRYTQLPIQNAHTVTILPVLRQAKSARIASGSLNINHPPFWIAQTDSQVAWEFAYVDQNGK